MELPCCYKKWVWPCCYADRPETWLKITVVYKVHSEYASGFLSLCLGLWREVTPTLVRMWSSSGPWGIQTCQNSLLTMHCFLGKYQAAPPSDLISKLRPPWGGRRDGVFLTEGKLNENNVCSTCFASFQRHSVGSLPRRDDSWAWLWCPSVHHRGVVGSSKPAAAALHD